MREPSASQLALAARCGFAFTSGISWPQEPQSHWGMLGDRVHLGCEALVTGEEVYPAAYHGLTPEEVRKVDRAVRGARELLELTPPHDPVRVELLIRYDVEKGRARAATDRFERKVRGEWTTIVDWLGVRDDVVLVRDWKSGAQKYTDPARENLQVRLGAVAAAKLFGTRRARVELVHLGDDGYEIDGADFDQLDLRTIAAELRELRRSLMRGPTPPVPGAHCTQHYCRLKGVCPATLSALATVQPVGERFSIEIRDEEHARWTLERLPGAEAALEGVKAALKEFARKTPVHLPSGEIYGWREKEERAVDIDTPEREAALRQALGEHADVAIVRPPPKVTLTSIEEAAQQALEATGKTRGRAHVVRNALAALEATGGLTVSKYDACEKFRPKKAKEERA